MKSYQIIPETTMIEMSKDIDGENAFSRLLLIGEKYKEANTTPIYLLDATNMEILVTAKEIVGKRLN